MAGDNWIYGEGGADTIDGGAGVNGVVLLSAGA